MSGNLHNWLPCDVNLSPVKSEQSQRLWGSSGDLMTVFENTDDQTLWIRWSRLIDLKEVNEKIAKEFDLQRTLMDKALEGVYLNGAQNADIVAQYKQDSKEMIASVERLEDLLRTMQQIVSETEEEVTPQPEVKLPFSLEPVTVLPTFSEAIAAGGKITDVRIVEVTDV